MLVFKIYTSDNFNGKINKQVKEHFELFDIFYCHGKKLIQGFSFCEKKKTNKFLSLFNTLNLFDAHAKRQT